MFPPFLNPQEAQLGVDEPTTAIKRFTALHQARNHKDALRLAEYLVAEHEGQNTGKILNIRGPMYSAKSGIATEIHRIIRGEVDSHGLHTLIFSGMGEKFIHARSASDEDIPADPVSLDQLEEFVDEAVRESYGQRQVVFIEEATFFATNDNPDLEDEMSTRFVEAIKKLQASNISVVLIGLDNNYRGLPLAVTQKLAELGDSVLNHDCESFFIYPHDSQTELVDADLTIRYSNFLGMFDWAFPILVPRSTVAIEYSPIPRNLHPLEVIGKDDPMLYATLIALSEHSMLSHHNQLADSVFKSSTREI